ncbi:MAG: LptF/LptG family permease [Rickettsiaceae bacterium]|nr:LptF/LptG family permease [Rickettsiaceae bacterium]
MLIYKKYILKSIIPTLVTFTMLLTSLVWITQILRMVHLIDKGIDLQSFFALIIFFIPHLLFMILPIISVIAVIYVYSRLREERQLVILKSSGLSNYDLAKPGLVMASYITMFAYLLSAYLVPFSYSRMKEGLDNFNGGYTSNIIHARTFNQISKFFNIYVDNKNLDGSFDGVILFDNQTPHNRTIIFSKTGKIILSDPSKTEFIFQDGVRHSYDQAGNITKLYFDQLSVLVTNEVNNNIRNKTSVELYIDEMLWPDDKLSIDKQRRLVTDGHLRIIWPVFNFAFVFLSLSIFLNQPYNRKAHIKQFIVTFAPLLLTTYFHFSLQKIAYTDANYIFLCYANVLGCIVFSIWQSTRRSL